MCNFYFVCFIQLVLQDIYDLKTTRGNDYKLNKVRAKYDLRKYFFTNRVVNIWNSLPNYVITAEGVNSFKSRLINL